MINLGSTNIPAKEMGRKTYCTKAETKKGPWTPQEDKILQDYVRIHGEGKWRVLAQKAGLNRCGKSCRLRWLNYLRPDIKLGNISDDEEDLIIRLHRLLGNRWTLIAGRLPGRSGNEIKNYWKTTLSKKLLAQKNKDKLDAKLEAKKSEHQLQLTSTSTTATAAMQIPSPNPEIKSTERASTPSEHQNGTTGQIPHHSDGTSFRECSGSISSLLLKENDYLMTSFWGNSENIGHRDAIDKNMEHKEHHSNSDDDAGTPSNDNFSSDNFSKEP